MIWQRSLSGSSDSTPRSSFGPIRDGPRRWSTLMFGVGAVHRGGGATVAFFLAPFFRDPVSLYIDGLKRQGP